MRLVFPRAYLLAVVSEDESQTVLGSESILTRNP